MCVHEYRYLANHSFIIFECCLPLLLHLHAKSHARNDSHRPINTRYEESPRTSLSYLQYSLIVLCIPGPKNPILYSPPSGRTDATLFVRQRKPSVSPIFLVPFLSFDPPLPPSKAQMPPLPDSPPEASISPLPGNKKIIPLLLGMPVARYGWPPARSELHAETQKQKAKGQTPPPPKKANFRSGRSQKKKKGNKYAPNLKGNIYLYDPNWTVAQRQKKQWHGEKKVYEPTPRGYKLAVFCSRWK